MSPDNIGELLDTLSELTTQVTHIGDSLARIADRLDSWNSGAGYLDVITHEPFREEK